MAMAKPQLTICLARNAFRNNVGDLVTINKRLSDLIQSIGGVQHAVALCGKDEAVKGEQKPVYFGVTSDLVLQLEKQSFEVVTIRNHLATLFRLSGYSPSVGPETFANDDEPPLWHTAADAPFDKETQHHLFSLNRAFCNVADTLEEVNGRLCVFAKWFTGVPARVPETRAEAESFDEFAVEGMVNSLMATAESQKSMIENILSTLSGVEVMSYEDGELEEEDEPPKMPPFPGSSINVTGHAKPPVAPVPPEPKFGP